jgi:hypothetical protein
MKCNGKLGEVSLNIGKDIKCISTRFGKRRRIEPDLSWKKYMTG